MSARLFAERDTRDKRRAHLSPATTRHLRALRLEIGDTLEAVLGPGDLWRATLATTTPAGGTLALHEKLPTPPEDPHHATWLLVALAEMNRTETLVEKATELGATDIVFFRAARSQAREISDTRRKRLERIGRAACEQCGRTYPPRLHTAANLEEACQSIPHGLQLIAFDPTAKDVASPCKESIAILIGPEGGFNSAELAWLERQNIARYSLGPRILRFETAAIAALAKLRR